MFRFKQFTIQDGNTAMKIGTDGTLLGCWVDIVQANYVLDIGTGSGVISAICAQKNQACNITAVEIDQGALLDASENFKNLPNRWGDRIKLINSGLQNFQTHQNFDHIISNPPFFEKSQRSHTSDSRNKARHTDSLHYSEILDFARHHLTVGGRLSMILPTENGEKCIQMAEEKGFFVERKCYVKPVPQKFPHRLLLTISNKNPSSKEERILVIETGVKRHEYTEEYKDIGRGFYLYF